MEELSCKFIKSALLVGYRSFTWTIDTEIPKVTVTPSDLEVGCDTEVDRDGVVAPPRAEDEHDFSVGYSDRLERCHLRRNWTVRDVAGNVAWAEQVFPIASPVNLEFLPRLTLTCDSSSPPPQVVAVPVSSSSASAECFEAFLPVSLSVSETEREGRYPCPGQWTRTFTATDACNGKEVTGTQVSTCSISKLKTVVALVITAIITL